MPYIPSITHTHTFTYMYFIHQKNMCGYMGNCISTYHICVCAYTFFVVGKLIYLRFSNNFEMAMTSSSAVFPKL